VSRTPAQARSEPLEFGSKAPASANAVEVGDDAAAGSFEGFEVGRFCDAQGGQGFICHAIVLGAAAFTAERKDGGAAWRRGT